MLTLFLLLSLVSVNFAAPRGVIKGDSNKDVKDDVVKKVVAAEEKLEFKPEEKYLISKDVSCAQDVENNCKKVKKENNFAIFVCLQEVIQKDEDDVTMECHETLWHYKYNLTKDAKFDEAAFQMCDSSLMELKECQDEKLQQEPGYLTNCLIEHRHKVTDAKCKSFLTKMSAIVFEDYRLIRGFYDHCASDVKKFKCGTISQPEEEEKQHEQMEVISCLDDNIEQVTEKCQDELLKIAELQADDYHLDRPLFYACQEARERFCHDVKSGEGRIFKCLMTHANEDLMQEKCSSKLIAREKMMQKDVKVNYMLWESCKDDVEKYKCKIDGHTEHGAASGLLLCLQGKFAEGLPLNPTCQSEMRSFAVEVFENYQISPIIVNKCDQEIEQHCKHLVGKRDDGDMMDCLMTVAASNDSLSDQCFQAVSEVLKETGAGNNYKVDRALYLACEPVITTLCEGKDDAMVLGCLMDHAHNPKMPEACAAQVFHLQYFLSRDFRLDASLYKDCRTDAEEICNANDFTAESETKMPDNFVIACLYRNSIHKNVEKKVSQTCADHVFRIMHQRATNIRLMPELERPCLADLGKLCLEKGEKEGEEIECLQTNYENLTKECKAAIKEFTVEESLDFDLDKHLVDKCAPMVQKFCQRELEDGNGEKVLPCLVKHKNDIEMDHLCSNAVEHWQLLEIKDFEFSPALKDMCLEDIRKHCSKATSKIEAVHCLSEKIVTEMKEVTEKCRAQVKNELMEQSENLKLYPELYEACGNDIKLFCQGIPSNGAQLEECLRQNHKKLTSTKCKKLMFNQEKQESQDPDLDYRLMHVCKPMIKKYCMSYTTATEIMECLRQVTHDRDMDKECRLIIKERQIEQAETFELDPELSQFCKQDVSRYCGKELSSALKGEDEGAIFGCLVGAIIAKKPLKRDCENYVRRREAEAAQELNLNPQFLMQCRDEVDKVCSDVDDDKIIECMKMNIAKIKSKGCVEEVRKLIVEGIEDVHVDPHLEEQCARDMRTFCNAMPKKSGNVVLCLIDVHKAKNLHLEPNCENFLTKRLSIYNSANVDLASFDSISAVMDAVNMSPNRNYIYMTVLLVLTILFLGGILFGRLTKKIRAEIKNR